MTEKRVVRGLLDLAVADALGETVTVGAPSTGIFGIKQPEDYFPVDSEALRIILDAISKIGLPEKKPVGRPTKKNDALRTDNQRAFLMWYIAQSLPENQRNGATVSDLIGHMNKNYKFEGQTKKAWNVISSDSEEQSVSRGRTYWKIDKNWHSAKLDAFWQALMLQ